MNFFIIIMQIFTCISLLLLVLCIKKTISLISERNLSFTLIFNLLYTYVRWNTLNIYVYIIRNFDYVSIVYLVICRWIVITVCIILLWEEEEEELLFPCFFSFVPLDKYTSIRRNTSSYLLLRLLLHTISLHKTYVNIRYIYILWSWEILKT